MVLAHQAGLLDLVEHTLTCKASGDVNPRMKVFDDDEHYHAPGASTGGEFHDKDRPSGNVRFIVRLAGVSLDQSAHD